MRTFSENWPHKCRKSRTHSYSGSWHKSLVSGILLSYQILQQCTYVQIIRGLLLEKMETDEGNPSRRQIIKMNYKSTFPSVWVPIFVFGWAFMQVYLFCPCITCHWNIFWALRLGSWLPQAKPWQLVMNCQSLIHLFS